MSEKRCYSIDDIQEILGICKTTAYNLIKENKFRTILIGGKYRISRKSFDAWLDGEMTDMEPEQHKDRMELGGVEREEDQRESILNRYTSATR